MEKIVIYVIVFAAVCILVRKTVRFFKGVRSCRDESEMCGGCSGCGNNKDHKL